jgi:hypothetical protein
MFCYTISCNLKFIRIKLYTISCYACKGTASIECSPFHSWFWMWPFLLFYFLLCIFYHLHTHAQTYMLYICIFYILYILMCYRCVWMCACMCGVYMWDFLGGCCHVRVFLKSRKLVVYTVHYHMLSEVCREWMVSCTVLLLMGSHCMSLNFFCVGTMHASPDYLYLLFLHARYTKIVKIIY